MLMTFYSLIVHTYGFQHYITLTWLQWQRWWNRLLCFDAKKVRSNQIYFEEEDKNHEIDLSYWKSRF
jgi:hypothetical protein